MGLVRFAKVTIHIGESTTELLLCLFWCDALFLRRVADQSVTIAESFGNVRYYCDDRSIDVRASESTLRNFGGAAGSDNGTLPGTAAHHLMTLNSRYVCHLPATRRPPLRDTVLPVSHSRNLWRRFVPRTPRTSSNAPGISIHARHDPDTRYPRIPYTRVVSSPVRPSR